MNRFHHGPARGSCIAGLFLLLVDISLATPRISCDRPEFAFGNLFEPEIIEHQFFLKNAGDAPLVIEKVEPACDCTTNRLDKQTLAPGETTSLTVTTQLADRLGEQDIVVFVFSNDPETPRYPLSLQGRIRRAVEVSPRDLFFRQVLNDSPAGKSISVVSGDGKPFRVLGVDTERAPFLDARLSVVKEGTEYDLQTGLKASATTQKGMRQGEMVIRTDHPRYAAITIPVTVSVDDEIVVTPAEIEIRIPNDKKTEGAGKVAPRDASPPRFLMVRSLKKKPISVLEAIRPVEGVEFDIKQRTPDQWAIRIRNLPSSVAMDGKRIQIRIKDSSGAELVLPVPIRVIRQ